MNYPCPTINSLIALGFEGRRTTAGLEGVGYRFVHLDLEAVPVMNLYARDVVLLTGVVHTHFSLGTVESQIPTDLGSALEAAAWVSYALKSYRDALDPLPDWFVEGESHWDLIPFVRELREYEARPKCSIDRDYARVLRRKLLEELSLPTGEAEMIFSFDGRILSIALPNSVHEVVASGDGWPSSYQVTVAPEATLPARFKFSMVEVSVFNGYLLFDRRMFGPCAPVA